MKFAKFFIFINIMYCVTSQTLLAQDYLKVDIGYNPQFESQLLFSNNSTITADTINNFVSSGNSSGVYGSQGNGLKLSASVGYKITNNLIFEFGVNYFMSKKYTFSGYYKRTFYGGDWYSSNTKDAVSTRYLGFNPSLVFSQEFKKFNTYVRFGVILAYCGKENAFWGERDSKKYGYYYYSGNRSYTGTFSLGLNSGVGTSFSLSEKVSLFGEITLTSLYATFEESELTEYKENGVDVLKYLTVNQKRTQYVNAVDSKDPYNPTEPSKRLSYPVNFNSVGFQFGIQINVPEVNYNKPPEKALPQAD